MPTVTMGKSVFGATVLKGVVTTMAAQIMKFVRISDAVLVVVTTMAAVLARFVRMSGVVRDAVTTMAVVRASSVSTSGVSTAV